MEELEKILQEIEFGKLTVIIQNGKIISIPEQEVEHPGKIDGLVKIIKIKKAIEIDQ